MLYESRSYALHPGKLPEYLAAFGGDSEVLAILARRLAGFWITESGQLNGVHHLWRYENRAARAAARAAMAGEPAMGRFFSKVTPLLQTQHSRLLAGQIAQGNATRTGGVYDRVRLVLRPDAAGRAGPPMGRGQPHVARTGWPWHIGKIPKRTGPASRVFPMALKP
ncbi:MAG: hypothetical protein EBY24_20825 [Betaproteobacteria bacterium]|nr:hypothetical protein [Betaproteobacteria bacterium]